MSICASNMSANTPVKKPSKEGEHFQSHPDFTKNFKLINDPILTRCPPPTYRYDGVMPGLKSPIEVVDPRSRFPRTNTRSKNIFLPIPEFIVDKHYVLPIKPKEISFTNLNNNVNVKFLEDMCKCFGIIQDTFIYYHPTTKKHLGLGKVIFATSSSARKCAEKLNNTSSMGNILNVFLDDKGAERDKLFKELTKDPSKAEFMPPMPNAHLKKDVLIGMFPATSTPTSLPQSMVTTNTFASPGADKIQTPANHNQAFIASQVYSRSHSLINSDYSTNGDAIVLQRKSSTAGSVHRSSSGEGLFGSSISGNSNPDLANKSSQRDSNTTATSCSTLHSQQVLTSPVSSSVPFHNRQAPNFNQSLCNNSRESRPQQKPSDLAFWDNPYKDKTEVHGRIDKSFDHGAKERPFRREDRHADKKWTWHQGKDYKDRQNKNGDKSNWKDKYSSPNNRKNRNRDRKDLYDNSYNRSGWSKQVRDTTQESSIRVPDNSQSFENLLEGSHIGTPGPLSNDRGKSKSIDTPDKNGQTPFSDLDDKKTETAIKINLLDKRMNLLANSDDNAVDSSHLFVQCPKKGEPTEQEDDKHESLESRIQALLGQNLPFALPSSTAQIPVVPQSMPQKSPPQPPLPPSPSPPLPPPPSQCDLDINIPPPSIYSFPPPPLTVPLPMTPVVPPNISYPTLPQNLSIFPISVGSVPSLVAQHVEPSRPAMMVQWRFHSEAVSTPPPSMTLPPLNIPPPPLPTQGVPATLHQEEQDPEIKQMEEEKAKFRKVFNELIYQLKEVLSKDLKKKMVEASAFKEFEDWWNEKSKEHNEKILNSKQQMKMTGSSSGADLRNGEQKVVAAVSEKSSAVPPPDRSQIMDTLSGLFDKSGSFAGGLLGLRKMRLTSMPSFRKKPEPPKIGNERIKNIHEDDEDEDDMSRRPVFRGPRTPEGSENEENLSDSSSGSDSDSETLHVGRPDPGKSYKPPSPPPSPIHTRKEPDKKSKVKVERKVEKPKPKSQKMEIYSSSSSDSDLSRKEEEDYNDELSDGSSDIDVMNLVKKVKEPARKFAVYTSDEEDEDYADGSKRTSTPQKGKAPSICSSPSVSDSDSGPEKQIDVCAVDRDSSKKSAIIKTSTPKLKPPVGRTSSKVQKEEGSKRKYTSRKPKNSLPQKKQRVRSRSTRGDDDDVNYVSHIKKVDVRSSNYMSLKENDHATSRQQITGERKRCTSLASADIRMHETKNYDEIQPLDGYLHLLSDVASEVKQAEVNKTYSTAFFASDQTEQKSKFGSAEYSGAHPNEEMREARKIRTYSQGDVTSQAPLQEMEKRLPLELDDHYYSLKPWMEVKSKKGRKPKPKPSAPTLNSKESDAFSGDETVALFPSDDEESTKFSNVNCNGLALLLHEHSYASANIFSPDMLYRSRSSDSEGDDVATDWPQVYVEDLDVSMNNNMGGKKFTLEMIPHIGREVDIAVEKPEQEKNINVVDDEDEEEEGECHSSSDEDKMVIDEGLSKPAPGRKRKRSTVDADVEVSEKKMKVEKKFQHSAKHSSASGKLPRELVNLIQSSFSTPEPKPVKFMKRDFKEEAFILYDFVTKGIDEEDANFIKLQFEKIHQREQEKILDHVESHCKWAFESKWIGHPVKTDFDSPSSKKSRKSSKHKGFEPHKSGSARTEGYYKIPHQAKQYLKHAHGVQEQQSIQVNSDEFPASSISSTSLLTTETTLDAMVRKRAQQNREARSEGRRWQNLLTSNLGEDVAELLKFNQLQIRKKQLRFAKSRIHDWGLFAMEPIAEGELVIEYVGQIIRQSVADLREKRYEADGIGSSYLFRIDQSTIVDATRFGNLSRFINHCCNPNCYAKIVSVDGVKRIVIYSRRDIEVNEEITYDYKFPIEDDKIPCLCGASGCRGTLN